MRVSLRSLQTKLLLTTLTFLMLLTVALALLVMYGFRETQRNATEQSIASLQVQGREALLTLIEREGQLSTLYFQQPAIASRTAAAYLSAMKPAVNTTARTTPSTELAQHSDGRGYDANPARLSDVFVPSFVSIENASIQRTARDSAFLDSLAPTLLEENVQAVAIYYVSRHNFLRYYPMNSLEGAFPADLNIIQEPWFEPTGPKTNPERQTTWSPLYLDDVGNGLMITTCSPVYDGDTFDGVVCLDVTLDRMIEHLEDLKLTPNSYAFLANAEGQLIAGPPIAVQQLTELPAFPDPEDNQTIGLPLTDQQVRAIIQQDMNDVDDIQTIELDGEPAFLATVTLDDLNWHLGLVAPVAEVTAQSNAVVGAIEQGTVETMRTTTIAMVLFFIFAVAGVALFSLRLTQPISTLVTATEAVARGELATTIPVTSQDELGKLAASFNRMTQELLTAREGLEQLVVEKTDALEERARLQEEVVQQAQVMLAMSTPLIPVSDKVIVMPLIGSINPERAQQVLDTLLRGVAAHRAEVTIIDITGVPVVDTFVAEALIRAAQAVQLLGASVILTGIRPETAQTLVGLGVDLRGLITHSTLQSGIEHATHMQIKSMKGNGHSGKRGTLPYYPVDEDESGKN